MRRTFPLSSSPRPSYTRISAVILWAVSRTKSTPSWACLQACPLTWLTCLIVSFTRRLGCTKRQVRSVPKTPLLRNSMIYSRKELWMTGLRISSPKSGPTSRHAVKYLKKRLLKRLSFMSSTSRCFKWLKCLRLLCLAIRVSSETSRSSFPQLLLF